MAGDDRLLRIYMNDQLALGVLWREIARRAHRAAGDSAEGAALGDVAAGIGEDVVTFRQIMRRLGFGTRTPKNAMAVVAERVGRLKLNGHLVSRSPLSRFEELDFLVMGSTARSCCGRTCATGLGSAGACPTWTSIG